MTVARRCDTWQARSPTGVGAILSPNNRNRGIRLVIEQIIDLFGFTALHAYAPYKPVGYQSWPANLIS